MPDETTQVDIEAALEETRRLLESEQLDEALTALSTLHAADQARVLAQLDPDPRATLLPRLTQETLAEIIDYLEEEPRRHIVAELDAAVLGPVLDRVDSDVAVDALHALPQERAQETLATMTTAAEVAPLLGHPDETAGGRMTTDFVALHKDWTVEQSLSYLRRTKPAADQAFYLYAVDDAHRLAGVVSLRGIVVAAPEQAISDVMTPEVVSVVASEDQEEVAREVQRYNFVALPVVDEERHLVGVVNFDDLMDVAEEEATEDMFRMAGLTEDESLLRPITHSIVPRMAWLLVAMVSVFGAAAVVSAFENTIEDVVALAVFMPIIAGLGGNAGVQTITLVVRSLALGSVRLPDVRRILVREVAIGVTNGIVIGVILGLLAYAWKGNVALGVITGTAMLLSMTIAVAAGVLVPLTLRRFRLDPALAAGVLVTTVTDAVGFFIFLGLATLMVDRLT